MQKDPPPSSLQLVPTCVDGLDVSLQVAVDGEDLVAAWVGARPLSHLLMVLLDVLLQNPSFGGGGRNKRKKCHYLSAKSSKKQAEPKTNRVLQQEGVTSDLPNISRFVDGCAALIWTLVDVWQLFPDNENSNNELTNLS